MMALYAHLWNYRAESTDCEIYYAAALRIELFSRNLFVFVFVFISIVWVCSCHAVGHLER